MNDIDAVLNQTYVSFRHAVDRIASSSSLRQEFMAQLPPELKGFDADKLIHRLLNLRKSGTLRRYSHQGI